jgi:DNA-directed RNA polymerase subunit M/transcription elongation factor TFIIS
MMSVTRTNETVSNKCTRCQYKWTAMIDVDIIDWDDNTSSLVPTKDIQCPKCKKTSPIKKINDKNE